MTLTRPAVVLPSTGLMWRKQAARVADLAHESAASGRGDVEYFLEEVEDTLGISGEDDRVTAIFDAVIAAWKARAKERRDAGLISNIDAAFAELNSKGVVARGAFTCCGTCANTEIWDEAPDGEWLGYIYFHQQDAESIPERGQTYLGYGANMPHYISEPEWDALSEDARDVFYLAVVKDLAEATIIPVLRAHGLSVTWNGDLATRILVDGITDYLVPIDGE